MTKPKLSLTDIFKIKNLVTLELKNNSLGRLSIASKGILKSGEAKNLEQLGFTLKSFQNSCENNPGVGVMYNNGKFFITPITQNGRIENEGAPQIKVPAFNKVGSPISTNEFNKFYGAGIEPHENSVPLIPIGGVKLETGVTPQDNLPPADDPNADKKPEGNEGGNTDNSNPDETPEDTGSEDESTEGNDDGNTKEKSDEKDPFNDVPPEGSVPKVEEPSTIKKVSKNSKKAKKEEVKVEELPVTDPDIVVTEEETVVKDPVVEEVKEEKAVETSEGLDPFMDVPSDDKVSTDKE